MLILCKGLKIACFLICHGKMDVNTVKVKFNETQGSDILYFSEAPLF